MTSRGSKATIASRSAVLPAADGVPEAVVRGEIPWAEWRSCLSKPRYPTPKDAKAIAKRHHKHHPDRGRLRPYRCQFCGEWHLTSQDRTASGGEDQ